MTCPAMPCSATVPLIYMHHRWPDVTPASTPQHNDDDTVQPKSNTLLQLAVVLTMLCVGPWCEANDEFGKVIGMCADHGVDSFFRTVPTKSRAVARAQLKAIWTPI